MPEGHGGGKSNALCLPLLVRHEVGFCAKSGSRPGATLWLSHGGRMESSQDCMVFVRGKAQVNHMGQQELHREGTVEFSGITCRTSLKSVLPPDFFKFIA